MSSIVKLNHLEVTAVGLHGGRGGRVLNFVDGILHRWD